MQSIENATTEVVKRELSFVSQLDCISQTINQFYLVCDSETHTHVKANAMLLLQNNHINIHVGCITVYR